MTEPERERCIKRMIDDGRDAEQAMWNLRTLKNILLSWQFYGFCLAWGFVKASPNFLKTSIDVADSALVLWN